jgi:hypothetical protein
MPDETFTQAATRIRRDGQTKGFKGKELDNYVRAVLRQEGFVDSQGQPIQKTKETIKSTQPQATQQPKTPTNPSDAINRLRAILSGNERDIPVQEKPTEPSAFDIIPGSVRQKVFQEQLMRVFTENSIAGINPVDTSLILSNFVQGFQQNLLGPRNQKR